MDFSIVLIRALCLIMLFLAVNVHAQSFIKSSDTEKLKDYDWYIEHNMECKKCISHKKFLKNGHVVLVETSSKRNNIYKGLFSKYAYDLDSSGNRIGHLKYDLKDPKKNNKTSYNTKYDEKGHVLSQRIDCYVFEYSDFTKDGRPRLIIKKLSDECPEEISANPFKTELTYNESGNIVKTVCYNEETVFQENKAEATSATQTETIWCTYDENDNVVTLNRAYDPIQKFPITVWGGHIGGGMKFIYEKEAFRYVYNEDGLWTKKYRIAGGKEQLVAKRKYKKGKRE